MTHKWPRFAGIAIAVLTLLPGLLCSPAAGSRRGLPILNPKNYRSPSGEYLLNVDPSDRYGRHAATYHVTKNGEEVWSGKLPFTLWEAGISDSGVVGGYAYSLGLEGFAESRDDKRPGDFLVVIIAPDGTIRLREATERESSRFIHAEPVPVARGLMVDGPNDRLVVRVADPDLNRSIETWWIYRLSTGDEVGRLQPNTLMADPTPARFIIDAQPVDGFPLTLLHWWRYDDRGQRTVGARFTLVDLNAKPVWTLDLHKDYEIPGGEQEQRKLRDLIGKKGALLRTDQFGRFALYFAAESQRVTFTVKQRRDRSWLVSEVGREPHSIAPAETEPANIPERPLKFLGSLVLRSHAGEAGHPIRNVWDFVPDGRGRIAFLRNEPTGADPFVLVDGSGKVVYEIRLPDDDESGDGRTDCTWVGGQRFVITRSEIRVEGKAQAWWLDVETGKLETIPGFDCPPVVSIAGSADGSFVVLARMRYRYTSTETLRGFNANGEHGWTVDQGEGTAPDILFDPADVAVTTTGDVTVVDTIKKTVQIFDGRGKFLRVIDLKEAWERVPNYPTGVSRDANGGFLVHDFNGSPPFVRMKADGTVLGGFRPEYADGRTFNTRGGVQAAPDGRFWTSDGHALLRLNDSGIVDLILGEPPDAAELGKITALTVDRRDFFYAVDRRTGSVHVFDSNGKFLHVCKTEPTDFPDEVSRAPISVTDQGDVYLGLTRFSWPEKGRIVHFSADGTRLGVKQAKTSECYVQPGTGNLLALDYVEAYLVNPAGETIRTITRQPDGNHLVRIQAASMAPDGSFALVAGNNNFDRGPPTVNIYDAMGEPVRTIALPSSFGNSARIGYNGRHLVAASNGRVIIFDATGSPQQSFEPESKDERKPEQKRYWEPFLLSNSRELVLFDYSSDTLWRYAIE